MRDKERSGPGPVGRIFSGLRRSRTAIIVYTVTALLCVASFFLPGIVLAARDRTLARSDDILPADEVQLSLLSNLSMAQRLALVGDPGATEVYLASGRSLTEEEAREHASALVRGMSLMDKSVSEFEVSLTPQLRVAADNSALLTWTAVYTSDSRDVTVIFDDEGGSCLAFRQISYPHGKAALSGAGVTGSDQSSGEGSVSSWPMTDEENGKVTDEKFMAGYLSLISQILSPLDIQYSDVSVTSPQSVSAIIPYDNTYYSMPVSIRSVEHEGFTYALHISVNM